MGEMSRCGKYCGVDDEWVVYPVGADGSVGGGGDILVADIAGDGCAEVSGADST